MRYILNCFIMFVFILTSNLPMAGAVGVGAIINSNSKKSPVQKHFDSAVKHTEKYNKTDHLSDAAYRLGLKLPNRAMLIDPDNRDNGLAVDVQALAKEICERSGGRDYTLLNWVDAQVKVARENTRIMQNPNNDSTSRVIADINRINAANAIYEVLNSVLYGNGITLPEVPIYNVNNAREITHIDNSNVSKNFNTSIPVVVSPPAPPRGMIGL